MEFKVRNLTLPDRASAIKELERTGADAAGVGRMIDKARAVALKVEGIKVAAGNILKQEALSVGADAAVARGVINCSVERTDALIMGTRKQMIRLSKKLKAQPFGLKRLSAEIMSVLNVGKGEQSLRWTGGVLDLEAKPLVMGIINVTPDSFSDGGDMFDTRAAIDAGLSMVDEGADLLDIGGESSRPGAAPVTREDELARIIPVIEALAAKTATPISVDTYKASVALDAVSAGAGMINDISGLRLDPKMGEAAAKTGAGLIVMHMRGTPRDMQSETGYDDLVGEVYRLLDESITLALAAGVDGECIAVDPGIGFGKSVRGNLELLARLEEFTGLGRPILVGASRKSFIGKILGIEDAKLRLEGSLAAAVLAVNSGARIIRAHDVGPTRRAVDMAWAVKTSGRE